MSFSAHPWHGVSAGPLAPAIVTCFIELVPTDTVKYEIDKATGLLKLDRPQKYSNLCPMPYGFVPQTLCDDDVADLAMTATSRTGIKGDQDPLDVCVLCERTINHAGILMTARPIGGLRMIDGNEADDKIIAVLEADAVFGECKDISDVPRALIDRLRHYFLTYKDIPGTDTARRVEITDVYGADVARDVIMRSFADYQRRFKR
jgi:inorganic pyrophosphatase